MKINNSRGPQLSSIDAAKNRELDALNGERKATEGAKDFGGSAKVQLSERAQLMQRAKDIASQSEDVNEAKISRLQKLIDEGKYQVNASAIADKMVDEHMLFPSE